ncbi:conserved Plasmodium protein, unknown function [Plasmodium malariae]|uniref:Uncharacterized protein n=2 Tax=Plasmodium (Plasmodium) TaxID=418103 RepID=A0A1C3KZ09_PLAMA|nr:conserved Plasmodium protein, unknown function [Plasmodium malariae]SBT77505.1 conserved Plasmodium protein, unknown function [Plasmodium ovale]SBT79504.1 conserved Plasmodium protein, unknown function [Plasmodium malariae]SCO92959.1 conserved Plasmodium protein, unknown function [Plasmodium malariae]
MFYPGMFREKPKDIIPDKWKIILRVSGFLVSCYLICFHGELFDIPENNKLS